MIKRLLPVLIFVLSPMAAFAEGSCDHDTANRCADGQVWDAGSGSCVNQTTS
ncbi:hypothetical protein CLV77_1950 [Brevirhabdus pacifica]|uniref:hypothetical protein n=1 Tax=Brevirhabdus pacifica TaxID=1267768 RepID=UPI000CADA8C3|nr:hypothetical protein [Brevirhabdus pacifica]PJJ87382.1 hypothetical protein CLV77_1950 [Brevirhabdus pacifica]